MLLAPVNTVVTVDTVHLLDLVVAGKADPVAGMEQMEGMPPQVFRQVVEEAEGVELVAELVLHLVALVEAAPMAAWLCTGTSEVSHGTEAF